MTDQPSEAVLRVLSRARADPAFRERLTTSPLEAVKEYDLAEADRHWLVLPNFNWLVEGVLAGSARPGSAEALAVLRAAGIRVILNLGERPIPEDDLARAGLRAREIPVADFTAPSPAQLKEAISVFEQAAAGGEPVVVCCGAGLGRTGTVLAAALVRRGRPAAEAIAEVRARRPGSIETAEQEAAVASFERAQRGSNRLGR